MNALLDIINSINKIQSNLNPTEIYNEGWMTRLLVYYSIQKGIKLPFVDFSTINNWTSEALISSPFVKADKYKEGYTHADMALGDFTVNYEKRGEIIVNDNAETFGIIEAKMGSNLSSGTKHVANYNQASRNVACIAHNTSQCDCNVFFAVVAPDKKIRYHNLIQQTHPEYLKEQIEQRYSLYEPDSMVWDNYKEVMDKVNVCKVQVVSYEDWIDTFEDSEAKTFLKKFYKDACAWNRI